MTSLLAIDIGVRGRLAFMGTLSEVCGGRVLVPAMQRI
jgi:hypothetical protein